MSSWLRGLKGKLFLSAFLPVIAFALLAGISLNSMGKLGGLLNEAYTQIIPNMDSLGEMGTQRARLGYFIWAALASNENPEARQKFLERSESAFKLFKKSQEEYENATHSAEEAKNYAKARADKELFYAKTDEVLKLIADTSPESDAKAYQYMNFGEWHVLAISVQEAIAANMAFFEKTSIENNKNQQAERARQAQVLIGIALVCALSLFAVLMIIAHRVSKSIGQVVGDLDGSSQQLSMAIQQLSGAGQVLSETSTQSAASLEETVASLEELSAMVKVNSDNARQAATLSNDSCAIAEQGHREMGSLITSMQEIATSSKKIEEIIAVIDDISFQTNLLALNAAVEAARAGEQGKGFAVVADAVRSLAQRSAVAAKDIGELIRDSSHKVDHGCKMADQSGEALLSIVSSVKKVSNLNSEISAASHEQTTGIEQISRAMNQLDEVSQGNAASSEEIAASSEEISAQAQQMFELAHSLSEIVHGVDTLPSANSTKPSATSAEESPKVLKFAAKAEKKSRKADSSEAILPFDEDDSRKIGSTGGF